MDKTLTYIRCYWTENLCKTIFKRWTTDQTYFCRINTVDLTESQQTESKYLSVPGANSLKSLIGIREFSFPTESGLTAAIHTMLTKQKVQ